jgi:hypothetical protein
MFNTRISKLGGFFPDIHDTFVNRTGGTLTRGDIAAVDLTGSDADVDTLTAFLATEFPDLTTGPLANLVAIGATNDKGWIYVVCLDESVADNAQGRFGIIGLYDVKLAPGNTVVAAVTNGQKISPVSAQSYAGLESDARAVIGVALADGPVAAAAARTKCLFNGFCLNGARNAHQVDAKTANYTVLVSESGKTFTTVGAAGAVTFALPAAVVGLKFRFRVGAAQELRIDPNGTEVIALPSTGVAGGAGKYLTADADGETVDVECTKAGTWSVFGFTGTWTAEA